MPSLRKSLPEHIDHQEIVNPIANILESEPANITIPFKARMNAPSYSQAAERSPSEDAASETEVSSVVKHEYGERAAKIGCDSERIVSSVALFTSKSIKELEGLTVELQGLQEFLRSGTEHVQRDIDNALAGLKIIIDTISPWRRARHELRFRTGPRSPNRGSSELTWRAVKNSLLNIQFKRAAVPLRRTICTTSIGRSGSTSRSWCARCCLTAAPIGTRTSTTLADF